MNPHSHILCCGLTQDDLVLPFWDFMIKQVSVHGCLAATPDQINQMLAFAADKGVKPIVEEFPMTEEGVAEAIGKLVSGKMRYRGILKV